MSFNLSFRFHSCLGAAIVTSLFAPSIMLHFENRRRKLIDDGLPRLLEDIAESQETGMSLFQALDEASRRKYGLMNAELRKLMASLSWGIDFERAFKSFSWRIGTELSTKTVTLILEAIRLGGDLKTVFRSTAEFVGQMISLRDDRESQLRPYQMVVYASSLIFMLIVLVLYRSFFLPMALERNRFVRLAMSLEECKCLLFDLCIVEAIFGGLTAGKIGKGLITDGLKHSVVLTGIATVVFTAVF